MDDLEEGLDSHGDSLPLFLRVRGVLILYGRNTPTGLTLLDQAPPSTHSGVSDLTSDTHSQVTLRFVSIDPK